VTASSRTDGASADASRPEADTGRVVRRRHVRWGALTGTVTLLYVAFFAFEVAAAGLWPRLYNRLHELQGNAVSRLVLAVVLVSALFHSFNGLRITLCDLVPRLAERGDGLRFTVQFLTFAIGIPLAFVICWPSLSEVIR